MRWRTIAVLGAAALVLLVVGCTSETVVTTPVTTPLSSNTVTIIDFAFQPSTLTVPIGTTVTWTNDGTSAHTVTSDTNVFDSGQMQAGATFNYKFQVAGDWPYHCSNHPTQMLGTIRVQSAEGQPVTPVPPVTTVPGGATPPVTTVPAPITTTPTSTTPGY